jgi:hypothetical protein
MTNDEIRTTIQAFLRLVTNGTGSVEDDETQLALLLDRLALASHHVVPFEEVDVGEEDVDAPRQDFEALRRLVCERFPNYGFYHVVLNPTEVVADPKCGLGDAIDDIVDITGELKEVEWLWEHAGEVDALWSFDHGYRSHWRSHLRGLQLYLVEGAQA